MNNLTMNRFPVQWSEGMLLSPHHFQQNDIYWERQLYMQASMLNPYSWGIRTIRIDKDKFNEGELEITELEAIMEDGLIISYQSAIDSPADEFSDTGSELRLSLSEIEEAGEGGIVYLIVPHRGAGAASENAEIQRYASIEEFAVADENTGGDPLPIHRLKPKLGLSVNDGGPAYTSLPLLKIESGDDGRPRICNTYIPPLLRISAMESFGEISPLTQIRELLGKVRYKANKLAGVTEGSNEEEEESLPSLKLLHAEKIRHLVAGLPQLEVLCYSGVAHPFNVYEGMAALCGNLCSISRSAIPPRPLEYNHKNISPGLSKMMKFVERVVDATNVYFSPYRFSETGEGGFAVNIKNDWLQSGRALILEANYQLARDSDALHTWMTKSRRGSKSVTELLIRARRPGAKITPVGKEEAAKMGVITKDNAIYYKLENIKLAKDDKIEDVIRPGELFYITGEAGGDAPRSLILLVEDKKENKMAEENDNEGDEQPA